jgi:glycine/D-amino acid oxidase-like deaminating enzyme
MLDGKRLRDAEPHLRPGLAGALYMPRDSVCYPPCAARYLIGEAIAKGAKIFYNSPVAAVTDSGIRKADGSALSAGVTILAAGVETAKLLPELAVKPRKGHLLITDRRPGFLRHQLIELGYLKSAHASTLDSVAFNAQPRLTGQILIGSSRQFGAEDPTPERHMLSRMLNRAIEYMPELTNVSAIRTWTGFRAATPDKLPLIGPCPGFRNAYLATGHEGLGISTSLATARLLTDELLGRSSRIDRTPYMPDRIYAPHV